MIKSFLTPDRVLPPKGRVLLEAIFAETYDPEGRILVPVEHQKRYPHLARVVSTGQINEDVRVNDFVILEDEGIKVDRSYYDVFKLILNDSTQEVVLVVDNDLEPALREAITRYRENPSTENRKISVQDVNDDQWWTFNCSDVVDWTWDFQANAVVHLESISVFMIELFDPAKEKWKLYYIAKTEVILATLRDEDADDSAGSDQDRLASAEGSRLAGVQAAHQ